MSTLKATNLQHASATSPNITLGSDGSVAVGGGNISPQTGFRNRVINGSMVIDQRNAGASVTPTANGTYVIDRFRCALSQSSKYAVQQVSASGSPVGFTKLMAITSLSAYSVLASDYFAIQQRIEGDNVSDLYWGTVNASPVTLSFWAFSSQGGTFGGALSNNSGNRSYPFVYTLSVNTWTYVTITIPGDTAGTWDTGSSTGIQLNFGLGVGSTFSATAGAWAAGNFISATGATSVVGTNGATFYLTGVQVEKGTVATPFEFRSIGQELALCQRYFEVWKGEGFNGAVSGGCVASNGVDAIYQFLVEKRAAVTASINTAGDFYIAGGNWGSPLTCNSVGFLYSTAKNVFIQARSATSSLTIGHAGVFGSNNTSNARINFSAEL